MSAYGKNEKKISMISKYRKATFNVIDMSNSIVVQLVVTNGCILLDF